MSSEITLLVVGELSLAFVAWLWLRLSGQTVPWAWDAPTLVSVVLATTAMVSVNAVLYFSLRHQRFVRGVFAFFETELFPVIRRSGPLQLLLLAMLAGVGEELLFRGVLQPRIGIVASSLIFGVAHGPSRALWPMALWASTMSLAFALMYRESANILVPMLVHAGYDAAAFLYIRFRQLPGPLKTL